MGALLIGGAVVTGRETPRRRAFFSGAWGVAVGMAYLSFFQKLLEPQLQNPGNLPLGVLTMLAGLGLAIAGASFVASIVVPLRNVSVLRERPEGAVMSEARRAVVRTLADLVLAEARRRPDDVLRVAVTGITASGKSTLAAELCACVHHLGTSCVRIPVDGFHNPRAIRYSAGASPPRATTATPTTTSS